MGLIFICPYCIMFEHLSVLKNIVCNILIDYSNRKLQKIELSY